VATITQKDVPSTLYNTLFVVFGQFIDHDFTQAPIHVKGLQLRAVYLDHRFPNLCVVVYIDDELLQVFQSIFFKLPLYTLSGLNLTPPERFKESYNT
jgi:hypothetical protein